MQKAEIPKGRICATNADGAAKLSSVLVHEKRRGVVDELAGKYRSIGKKLAKEGKTSVDLIREARDDVWASKKSS